jgi:hypothetical protein
LLYFLAGFWFLSHARLLYLNARWLLDGVAKDADLERSWQRNALVVLLAIALIAAFLPIGSSLAISRILAIGLSGVAYLASLVFSFFGYLFAAGLVALSRNIEQTPVEPLDFPPPPPIQPEIPPATPNPLLTMVISSAFWALLIAFVIGSLLFFLRERGYKIEMNRVQGYWATVGERLQEAWAWLRGRARAARRTLRARLQTDRLTQASDRPTNYSHPRFFRLGALSPREQIRYYYLAVVRRAGERGVSRLDSETPLEFVEDLKNTWPESEGDFDEITNAFLEARYSPQPITGEDVNPIKERWKRLKAELRARR